MAAMARREPAIVRGASEAGELAVGVEEDAGLSASRSRLLLQGGLALGRGRSPTEASSYKISLKDRQESVEKRSVA